MFLYILVPIFQYWELSAPFPKCWEAITLVQSIWSFKSAEKDPWLTEDVFEAWPGNRSLSLHPVLPVDRVCLDRHHQRSSWSDRSHALSLSPSLHLSRCLHPLPWSGSLAWRNKAWWRGSLGLAKATSCWSLCPCCTYGPGAASDQSPGWPLELDPPHASARKRKINSIMTCSSWEFM